jgi:hypothetical protein
LFRWRKKVKHKLFLSSVYLTLITIFLLFLFILSNLESKVFTISPNSHQNLFLFCSYDTRGSHAGTPSHWKDEEILENRAIFRTVRSPAELVIKPVKVRKKNLPTAELIPNTTDKKKELLFTLKKLYRFFFFFSFFSFYFFSNLVLSCRRRKTLAIFGVASTLNFLQRGIVM